MAHWIQSIMLKIVLIVAVSALASAGKGFNADGEKDNGKRKLKNSHF